MNNKQQLCSVIITTFNRENLIESTLNSVLNQKYRPIQLIVIDDGSKDKTFEIVKKWEKENQNSSFKVHVQKQANAGAPSARNKALQLCDGEFIQEIGSDDLIHPEKLELAINALNENTDCSSFWSPLIRLDETGESVFLKKQIKNTEFKIVKKTANIFIPQFMPSAALHRRIVFTQAGQWNITLKRWQDLEYQVKMMNVIDKYIEFNEPLYFFRQHFEERITNKYDNKEGIKEGLYSLNCTIKCLNADSIQNSDVIKNIYNFYVSLYIVAVKNNVISLSNSITNNLLLWTPNKLKKYTLKLVFLFGDILGFKVLSRILKIFSYLK